MILPYHYCGLPFKQGFHLLTILAVLLRTFWRFALLPTWLYGRIHSDSFHNTSTLPVLRLLPILLQSPIYMAHILPRIDDITDSVLQFFGFWEAVLRLPVPEECLCWF